MRNLTLEQEVNGAHSKTTIDDFSGACETFKRSELFVFEKDEPPILLGKDIGANPVEYIFAALDSCLTTRLIYYTLAQEIKIDEVKTFFQEI